MKYIDSNIFILPIIYDNETDKRAKNARDLLIEIAEGNLKAATSFLTWDEIVWVIRKLTNSEIATKEGEKFLQFPNLEMVEVKKSTIIKAQEILNRYRIKPRDAIHMASAIENGIKEIVSDDSDFDGIKEVKRIPI